jgi:hypothetical protein
MSAADGEAADKVRASRDTIQDADLACQTAQHPKLMLKER